ncbi:MAG: hypothetical protein HKL90_13985 [Elusimicrobia bacterium]|nr:hypothetical protein [Elusimicrobiota bacterium]
MGNFSRTFVKLRLQSGFKTAYGFYRSNGGVRTFPFTYATYLKFERGETLPSPSGLACLWRSLRRGFSDSAREQLARDFLRDFSGDDATFDFLFAPLLTAPRPPALDSLLRNVAGPTKLHLSLEQMRVVVSSPEATGAFLILTNSSAPKSAREISAIIGADEIKTRAALRRLCDTGLFRGSRGKDGFRCRRTGPRYSCPPPSPASRPLYDKQDRNLNEIARRGGGDILYRGGSTIRLERGAAQAMASDLSDAINRGGGREEPLGAPAPGTALYLVEARVRKLADLTPRE